MEMNITESLANMVVQVMERSPIMVDKIEVEGYGLISKDLRKHWINVTAEPDASILDIDRLEDTLEFENEEIREKIYGIRNAITRFEFCHHKALHRLFILIHSIGKLEYLIKENTKEAKINNEDVKQWMCAYKILKAWTNDDMQSVQKITFFDMTSTDLVSNLGIRSPLKKWQVSRLLEKMFFEFLNFDGDEGEYRYFTNGEAEFQNNSTELEFYRQTMNVTLEELNNDLLGEMNLGKLIDLYFLCNWNYKENLISILQVINGNTQSIRDIVVCSLQFDKHPSFNEFLSVKKALRAYWDEDYRSQFSEQNFKSIDSDVRETLGVKTPIKIWLVRSLEKTLIFSDI